MSTTQGIEVKKDGLSQLQDGSWVLKLKCHPNDMPTTLMTAPMGTRYIAALVEIGDDEQPIKRKEKRDWNEVPMSQQAGIKCTEPAFQRFLIERYGRPGTESLTGVEADALLKSALGIASKTELDKDQKAAARWEQLWSQYRAWELT